MKELKTNDTIETLLQAPCMYCHFEDTAEPSVYWEKGSHELYCPWNAIPGVENRVRELRAVSRALYASHGLLRGAERK